ncbi:MAG: hypothetical protein LCH34_00545 [Firmicutes bacterium]|nr:hypothetical protein [Bacillota bacterium]
MSKRLCKLVGSDILEDDLKSYIKLVNKLAYVCKKCGRVANNEENLCKPKKLKVKVDKKKLKGEPENEKEKVKEKVKEVKEE